MVALARKLLQYRYLNKTFIHPFSTSAATMFPNPAPKLPSLAPRVLHEFYEGIRKPYPPIEAFMTGRLKVDSIHDLYYEQVKHSIADEKASSI